MLGERVECPGYWSSTTCKTTSRDVNLVGLAATFVEIDDVDPAAFDLDARRKKLAERQAGGIFDGDSTTPEHIRTVLGFQWLNTLVRYIPQLSHLRPDVSVLYRTRAAKLQLPIRPSKVHPLATTSRNETVTTELKDALVDFLEQIGQVEEIQDDEGVDDDERSNTDEWDTGSEDSVEEEIKASAAKVTPDVPWTNYFDDGTLFNDTRHWHNHNKPLLPKHLGDEASLRETRRGNVGTGRPVVHEVVA